MNAVHDVKKQAQHAADEARRVLAEGRAARVAHETQKAVLAALHEQTAEIQGLRKDLAKRRAGGGFPWGLLLLAGAGFALYRTTPGIRDQIQGLLKRVDPGVSGNLARAGDAVKGAVDNLNQDQNPGGNLGKAAGEAQRAGEKMVDRVKDNVQDAVQGARDQAREIVDDVQRDATTKGMA